MTVVFVDIPENEIASYIVTSKLTRDSLTKGQRAAIVINLYYEEERRKAKERMLLGKAVDPTAEMQMGTNGEVAETNEILATKAGEAIFEIGKRLKHVKENDLAHGEWSKWCETIGIDRSTANKFIRVYDELGTPNVGTYPQLGLRALYEIATLPPEQREQAHTLASGETKTVDEMTVRELREVKAELKRKQAELEAARRSEQIAMTQNERYWRRLRRWRRRASGRCGRDCSVNDSTSSQIVMSLQPVDPTAEMQMGTNGEVYERTTRSSRY